MYDFISGPLVWIAFLAFAIGSIFKIVTMIVSMKGEGPILPTMSGKYSLRSILHWIIPFRSRSTKMRPFFTALSFAFHLCLLFTPLLVMGHAVLWEQSWLGFSWWSLPPGVADAMTLLVIAGGVFFLLRRIALPQVRNVTTVGDYVILLIVVGPFLTGFIAHHQWLPYRATLILHIVSGCLWLIAIPFTRLTHMLTFIFTRAFMGSDFGSVRHARDW